MLLEYKFNKSQDTKTVKRIFVARIKGYDHIKPKDSNDLITFLDNEVEFFSDKIHFYIGKRSEQINIFEIIQNYFDDLIEEKIFGVASLRVIVDLKDQRENSLAKVYISYLKKAFSFDCFDTTKENKRINIFERKKDKYNVTYATIIENDDFTLLTSVTSIDNTVKILDIFDYFFEEIDLIKKELETVV